MAIDVGALAEAGDFFSRMVGPGPAKVRPGYANFAIDEPPLKLVLFEKPGGGGTINHLGVEVGTTAEVVAAEARLAGADLETTGIEDTECCYAEKTETWLEAPDDLRWEWYVKTADTEQFANVMLGSYSTDEADTTCCA